LAVFSHSAIENRSFSYRLPRYKTDFPIDLIVGDHVNLGVCKELSEASLLAHFALPVQPASNGIVTLYSGEDKLQFPVHIDSIRGEEVVMRASLTEEEERKELRDFIKTLVERGSGQVAES
jgi:hypothetical protein